MDPLGSLVLVPALDRPDLLADPVRRAIASSSYRDEFAVCEIDPAYADTAEMSAAYDLPLEVSANCVVVSGSRAGEERVAACVARADTRVDVNTRVRKLLDVRKCSFHPHEAAVEATGMEHGGITPVGLTRQWRLLIDARVVEIDRVVIGSGTRTSKLVVPGWVLAEGGGEVVDDLAR